MSVHNEITTELAENFPSADRLDRSMESFSAARKLVRCALALGVIAGSATLMTTIDGITTSNTAEATTTFTNDYPDLDAMEYNLRTMTCGKMRMAITSTLEVEN